MESKPLFAHQEAAVRFLLNRNGSGALFMDMGTGKTRAAIEAFTRMRRTDPGLKMLVVAPLSLLDAAWGEDIKRFSDLTYTNLHDDGIPDAWVADVWLINYESFIVEKNLKKLYTMLYRHPVMMVCDESSRMKCHNAKTTKSLLQVAPKAKYRVVMSGTPAPNTPMEYWGQMQFLDRNALDPSFYRFRNSYFHLARGSQVANMHGQTITREAMYEMMRKGWKYEISEANQKRLMDRIAPYSFRAAKEDCLDLPDMIDETRIVELGVKQRKAYNEMKHELITEIAGADITAPIALTKILKLREITSGFAFDDRGQAHDIGESAKLREFENVVEDIGSRQLIVWAQFHWEIARLVAMLSKIAPVATLYSGTDDRGESIRSFQDGTARYLVAHPRSAAHGLTFVNCSYEAFFSLDYSFEAYEQAKARIHRAGQTQKCTYLHLVAKNTIDEDILDVLKRKATAEDIVTRMMAGYERVTA